MELIDYKQANTIKLYEMYQDIPKKEWDFTNKLLNVNYEEFLKEYNNILNEEYDEVYPTKKYVLEDKGVYIGYIGLRLSKDKQYIKGASQLFYQIRVSQRKKRYSYELVKLGLLEMKKYGFDIVGINCNELNIPSKKAIEKNNGLFIKKYKSNTGISNMYKVKL